MRQGRPVASAAAKVGRDAPRAPGLGRTKGKRIHQPTPVGQTALVPTGLFLHFRPCPPIRGARGASRPTSRLHPLLITPGRIAALAGPSEFSTPPPARPASSRRRSRFKGRTVQDMGTPFPEAGHSASKRAQNVIERLEPSIERRELFIEWRKQRVERRVRRRKWDTFIIE